MIRVLVHACCPTTKRSIAGRLSELSQRDDEFAIPLRSLAGGRARAYQNANGLASNLWFGATQTLKPSIAKNMLDDGIIKSAELFFVVYDEATGEQLRTNLPGWPANATFVSFLTYIGCERLDVAGVQG